MKIIIFFGVFLSMVSAGLCIERTLTGFYYPMGSGELGPHANWLSSGCLGGDGGYFENEYHIGHDFQANVNSLVYTISDGEVILVSKNGWGTGNVGVIIKHQLIDNSYFLALYGHIISNITVGQKVLAGEVLGKIGYWPYGNHLHFGIVPGALVPASPWGRMSCVNWPSTNGFVDPINWLTLKTPRGNVGHYSDGFHSDGTSQAFLETYENYKNIIGVPYDNGGGVFVHEYKGSADDSFSVLIQDFYNPSTDKHYALVLNDVESPMKVYLLQRVFN